ncbi:MAG: esterase-like activity of phytase family protein [Planctomycetes bacterium]|nr:esterase-like activity of phytase family protein [Planctomycetota bacterium]
MSSAFWPLIIGGAALLMPGVTQELSIDAVGRIGLSSDGTGAGELSAITWIDDALFHIVSDTNATVYPTSIEINRRTGAVTHTNMQSGYVLANGVDVEGLAFSDDIGTLYAGDEVGPAVRAHVVGDGSLLEPVTVPDVFGSVRANFGIESLALQDGHRSLWFCNEEALTVDGPLSTTTMGTVIRIQRLDADLQPGGQWAYRTDAITNDSPLIDEERSGVSDLLVLPDGRVLVLERELGGVGFLKRPEFRSRIYEVDFTTATDTSAIGALDGAQYAPADKHLLWEGRFSFENYEGITLGPQLDDGSFCVLLVSDDGGGLLQSVYALRLYGAGPRLTQDDLVRGMTTTFHIEPIRPGETAYLLYSTNGVGPGPRPSQIGGLRLDLVTPVTVAGSAEADTDGLVTIQMRIPANAPLIDVSTQAIVMRGLNGARSVKTNTVTAPTLP